MLKIDLLIKTLAEGLLKMPLLRQENNLLSKIAASPVRANLCVVNEKT